jgi:leader peptidase (prepilin peptidase)/N-methyltransferase
MTYSQGILLFEIYAFAVGLCVGSFLNVVIYRLPLGASIVKPGSHCPMCGSPVRPYDNIPLVSWLVLMGLCRDCGSSISPRYFFVELLTGTLTWAVARVYGMDTSALLLMVFVWSLVAVTFIDLDHQIIPDEITLGGAVAGLAVSHFLPLGLYGSAVGLLVGGGIFFLIAVVVPGGMGGGDIKLMAAIGAFTGWKLTLLTIILGSAFGAVVGLFMIALFGRGRKDKIPFGPFLAIAAVISVLWGDGIINAYLEMAFW